MKLTIKKLQGGECTVDVLSTTRIIEVKRQVAQQLKIPVEEQKLLILGRTLVDEQTIQSYPSIKDGGKLNLVVKKPEGLYEVSYRTFKKLGMSDLEARNTAARFIKIVQEKFSKLSWDDIDRLALDCLLDDGDHKQSNTSVIDSSGSPEDMVL